MHKKLFNWKNSKIICVFFCLGLCKALTAYELFKRTFITTWSHRTLNTQCRLKCFSERLFYQRFSLTSSSKNLVKRLQHYLTLLTLQQVLNWLVSYPVYNPMECNVPFITFVLFPLLTLIVGITDHCHPNPCLNSGTCVQVLGGYDCHCDEQYTGAHCEGNKESTNLWSSKIHLSWVKHKVLFRIHVELPWSKLDCPTYQFQISHYLLRK